MTKVQLRNRKGPESLEYKDSARSVEDAPPLGNKAHDDGKRPEGREAYT